MATLNKDQVVKKLRDKQGSMSLRQFAVLLDVTPAYLSDIYNGRREPGPKILEQFNLKKTLTVTYTQLKNSK